MPSSLIRFERKSIYGGVLLGVEAVEGRALNQSETVALGRKLSHSLALARNQSTLVRPSLVSSAVASALAPSVLIAQPLHASSWSVRLRRSPFASAMAPSSRSSLELRMSSVSTVLTWSTPIRNVAYAGCRC